MKKYTVSSTKPIGVRREYTSKSAATRGLKKLRQQHPGSSMWFTVHNRLGMHVLRTPAEVKRMKK